ncbi:cellulase family glycosylhydrolase [Dyadobacter arcticus]|uniref:Poly(3-hydroxybutyrate) depolymerase n=1 Tax=Dyadobacter arcticus TaxID=1078754 RepID=A0ABX0UPF7_9BACT|nr:cellulase family glycosylhydrolase [Dyadobacter arcticus]NIJ54871.1 poly(3-hydroxybutyrate) depolymerase [Dyadobacter arcticus]
MKRFEYLVILILLQLTVIDPVAALDGSGSITSSGKTRSFIFHAPGATVGLNLPLLFVYHGDGGSGAGIRNSTEFNTTADNNNFIVVYPNADSDGSGWHRAIDQTKDVRFTSDLIDYFCSTYHIDAKKVYATGHSAGGYMTYNLAVNLPSRVAAFAPVSGNMYANNGDYAYFTGPNFKPVPILHIHGDPDNVVAYPDPNHTPTEWNEWPLTRFSYSNCQKTTYTLPNDELVPNVVSKLKFCVGNPPLVKEISMIRVVGTGHGWPKTTGFDPNQVIWDFVKNYNIPDAQSCAAVPEVPTYAEGTIHSNGRTILGPCETAFIPTGVNYSLADDWEFPANINGDPTHINDELSAQIIQANPNTVRIQWYANRASGWKSYSIADLDVVVSRFRNAGIVSVLELHDVTCSDDYTKFNATVMTWWKQQAVLDLLDKHKGFVILNVANEFGTVQWASNPAAAQVTWVNFYKNVITDLRNVGIEVPIMIDAPDCGQNLDVALQTGSGLKTHDPLHNIIMSVHAYWYADNAAAMEAKAVQIANAQFPIVLGEVANIQDAFGKCSSAILAYTDLLRSCKTHGIGWLAWTWTDDWCDGVNGRRISTNGNYTNLSAYGQAIINSPDFGLITNAVKMDVACLGGPLPVSLISFKAEETDAGDINLSWKTAEEINFKGFEIERSLNGKDFSRIAAIATKELQSQNTYEYMDRGLKQDVGYYRLKMVDLDGSYTYSSVAVVIRKRDSELTVYPSPAQDFVLLNAQEHDFPAKVKILDSNGRSIISQIIQKKDEKINIASLAEGLYIVVMNDKVVGKLLK